MIASNIGHGTTAAISARNTSRFVRFFLLAKSSDAKLNCASMPCSSNQRSQFAIFRTVDQGFLSSLCLLAWKGQVTAAPQEVEGPASVRPSKGLSEKAW